MNTTTNTPDAALSQSPLDVIWKNALEVQRRAGMLGAVSFGLNTALDDLNALTDPERRAIDHILYFVGMIDELIAKIGNIGEEIEGEAGRLNRTLREVGSNA